MWKYTAKYENYNGEQKEKVLRFNLTASELRNLQFSKEGGIDKYYEEVVKSQNAKEIYGIFEELVHLSYGIISEDGDSFTKSEEEYNKFRNSLAYEAFMDYIMSSDDGASKFILGIMPKAYVNKLNSPEGKKIAEEHGIDITALNSNN